MPGSAPVRSGRSRSGAVERLLRYGGDIDETCAQPLDFSDLGRSPVRQIDRDPIGTAGIDDRVDAGTAIEIILPRTADDRVVAGLTIDDVSIVAAVEDVIAAPAVEIVTAALAPEVVGGIGADEAVDAVVGTDQVFDAVERIARRRAAALGACSLGRR